MNSAVTRRILAPRFIVGPRKNESKMTLSRAILIIAYNGKFLEDLLVRYISIDTEDKGIISISRESLIDKKESAVWKIGTIFGPDVFNYPGSQDLMVSFLDIFENDCILNMLQKGFVYMAVSVRFLRRQVMSNTENLEDHPKVWGESKVLITEGLEYVINSLLNSICKITQAELLNPELVRVAKQVVDIVSADEL